MMNIKIRHEAAADIAAIENLVAAAFLNAPHASHTERFIVSGLRRAGQLSLSLVAEDDGVIVGHVAVSPVAIADGSKDWYGLGPISVTPAQQRRGIGTQLVRQALAELRRSGAAGCVVLGEPSYYRRFGFKTEPGLVLPAVPPGYFQAIVFRGAMPAGTVTYHEAFQAQA